MRESVSLGPFYTKRRRNERRRETLRRGPRPWPSSDACATRLGKPRVSAFGLARFSRVSPFFFSLPHVSSLFSDDTVGSLASQQRHATGTSAARRAAQNAIFKNGAHFSLLLGSMETKENDTGERKKVRARESHSHLCSDAHADDVGHAQQYARRRSQRRGQENGRHVRRRGAKERWQLNHSVIRGRINRLYEQGKKQTLQRNASPQAKTPTGPKR